MRALSTPMLLASAAVPGTLTRLTLLQTRSPTRSSNAFLAAPAHPTHLALPRFVDVPSVVPCRARRLPRSLLAT